MLESSWDIKSFLGRLGESERDDEGVVVGVCAGNNSRSVDSERSTSSPALSLDVRLDSLPNSRQVFSKTITVPRKMPL